MEYIYANLFAKVSFFSYFQSLIELEIPILFDREQANTKLYIFDDKKYTYIFYEYH